MFARLSKSKSLLKKTIAFTSLTTLSYLASQKKFSSSTFCASEEAIKVDLNTWNTTKYATKEFDWATYTVQHSSKAFELLKIPTSAKLVLDIACGTGSFALFAAEEFAKKKLETKVLATDYSSGMVDILKSNIQKKSLTNVTPQVMDAQHLTIKNESVDAIGCVFGVMFFPNREQAYSEMKRVLKPGGQVAIVVWVESETAKMADEIFQEAGIKEPVFDGDAFKLGNKKLMKDELERAGFRSVEVIEWNPFFQPSNPSVMIPGFLASPMLNKVKNIPNIEKIALEVFTKHSEKPWVNKSLIVIAKK